MSLLISQIQFKIIALLFSISLFWVEPLHAVEIRAVIFDCDGVLVDSEFKKFLAWQEALAKYNFDYQLKDYLNVVGYSSEHILKTIQKTTNVRLPKSLIANKDIIYHRKQREQVKPIQHNIDMLRVLVQQRQKMNIKLGLASSVSKDEIMENLKQMDLQVFDVIVSGIDDLKEVVDPEGTNKPKPYIYQKAVKLLGIPAENTLVFEDSRPGVVAAHLAGAYVVALPNEFTKQHDFSMANKVVPLGEPFDVFQYIKQIQQS